MGQPFAIWNYTLNMKPEISGQAGDESYKRAISWLDIQAGGLLEDWGCGTTYAKQFVKRCEYKGIDGAWTSHNTVVADLRSYISRADAILLRHVLEVNGMWRQVLSNALLSFRTRLCIVIGTPLETETKIDHVVQGVPIIHFSARDLFSVIYPLKSTMCTLPETGETFLFVEGEAGQQMILEPGSFPEGVQV